MALYSTIFFELLSAKNYLSQIIFKHLLLSSGVKKQLDTFPQNTVNCCYKTCTNGLSISDKD